MAFTTLGYKLQVQQQQQQYRRNNKQSQRLQIAMAYQQQQLGNGSSQSNQKSTQAYKLYSEGKTPVDVAIQLSLSEKEATRYYTEYWRLTHLYNLHSIYKELKGDLFPILKLYRLLKREGITIDKIEWFVHTVNTGMYKIPQIQKQYAK